GRRPVRPDQHGRGGRAQPAGPDPEHGARDRGPDDRVALRRRESREALRCPGAGEPPAAAGSRRGPGRDPRLARSAPPGAMILRCAAVFAAFFVVLASVYAAFPAFYDGDSYYHLAVARLYVAEGFVNSLAWARFSVLADGFGDK